MPILLNGKDVAERLTEKMSEKISLLKERDIFPTLAILRVGENESDIAYERGAMKRCEKVGVDVKSIVLPQETSQEKFDETLKLLNNDDDIHGILMLRPLPKSLDNEKARLMLSVSKDVDGCTDGSLSGVFTGSENGFAPCTAQAVIEILDYYDIEITGKRVAVIGRSLVVGRPVAMMLMHRGATPAICHTKTKDIAEITKNADIIVCCSGQMESIGSEYIADAASAITDKVIIDVGINWNEEKGKLCGDVKFDEVYPMVRAITPVPGGVGSVTSAVLALHVVEAAERASK